MQGLKEFQQGAPYKVICLDVPPKKGTLKVVSTPSENNADLRPSMTETIVDPGRPVPAPVRGLNHRATETRRN